VDDLGRPDLDAAARDVQRAVDWDVSHGVFLGAR
jgi:hypothetical protein